jgi:hypothetical protein
MVAAPITASTTVGSASQAKNGGAASFANLDITVQGHNFTDPLFILSLLNTNSSPGWMSAQHWARRSAVGGA